MCYRHCTSDHSIPFILFDWDPSQDTFTYFPEVIVFKMFEKALQLVLEDDFTCLGMWGDKPWTCYNGERSLFE